MRWPLPFPSRKALRQWVRHPPLPEPPHARRLAQAHPRGRLLPRRGELRGADHPGDRRSVVRRHDAFNLAVLPAGTPQTAPYELLNSPRLEALLAEARRHYDYVLIDTPPLIPFPDCRLVGKREVEVRPRILPPYFRLARESPGAAAVRRRGDNLST